MQRRKFDAVVVGSGPAGSCAALTLATGGARVGLVEKASFPRDKACGDLLGPRAVGLLDELGVLVPGAKKVGDMAVYGPTGRSVLLRCAPGRTYPGHALAVRRAQFDAVLRDAAIAAGAEPVAGQVIGVVEALEASETGSTVVTADGGRLDADFVIGADGATSRVAESSGLVDRSILQWGFAARCYLDAGVEVPTILFWETSPWCAVPGYGWVFPSPGGGSNAGIGVGTLSARKGSEAVKLLRPFLHHVAGLGLLRGDLEIPDRVLGGWLKMGMVGTVPAERRVLLVGDAAGLVNPLQGEGISQALTSGHEAALAVLRSPSDPAGPYLAALARAHLPYHRVTATVQRMLVSRPKAVSAVGRILTAPAVGRAVAPGWGLYWNELLEGSGPGAGRSIAACADLIGRVITARSSSRRWFDGVFGADGRQRSSGPCQPDGGSLAGKDSRPHSSTSSGSDSSTTWSAGSELSSATNSTLPGDLEIGFRPIRRGNFEQLRRWLGESHVSEWWGEPPDIAAVESTYGPCLDGSDPTKVFLITLSGNPIGMIQTYLLSDNPEYEMAVRVECAAGVDLLIGEPDLVGVGIGTATLRIFLDQVGWPAYPHVLRYMAGPAERNERSRRAFRSAGFVHQRTVKVPGEDDPEAVMVLERPLPVDAPAVESCSAPETST